MNTFRPLVALFILAQLTVARAVASPQEEMTQAANNLLAALTPDQMTKATYEFKADERFDWHFIPRERKGLPFKEMTPAQQRLAHALLASGMSQRGYAKATTIMSLEDILRELEQGKGPARDPERYFVTIFGRPDAKGTWGWRVEGHHISLNFTLVKGEFTSVTPSFLGTNPAEVKDGPRKGLRVLAAEEDLGRQLIKSLNDDQKKTAIYTNAAPHEIVTGNDRKARELTPMGVAAAKMNKAQNELLWQLVQEYVRRYRSELADEDLKKIEKAGRSKIHFAWAGSLEVGQGHYYRVQGPTFLLEYDDTQNNANHIHAVWRDLENDFGEDLLRKHYEQYHSK